MGIKRTQKMGENLEPITYRSPQWVVDGVWAGIAFVQHNGWYMIFAAVALLYLKSVFGERIAKFFTRELKAETVSSYEAARLARVAALEEANERAPLSALVKRND